MAIHAMQFQDENEKQKFIHDEKYFGSLNSYSLGKSLEEAGEILRKITECRGEETDDDD